MYSFSLYMIYVCGVVFMDSEQIKNKLRAIADQISDIATEISKSDNTQLSAKNNIIKTQSNTLTSELIEHFNIRNKEGNALLSKSETYFLNYLKKHIYLNKKNGGNSFSVHCQVALNALFDWTMPKNFDYSQDFYSRILNRRVDFVIVDDKSGIVSCVIELDGSSHNNVKAGNIDADKATVLRAVNIPIVHIRTTLIFAVMKSCNNELRNNFNSLLFKLFNSFNSNNPLLIGEEVQGKIYALLTSIQTT